MIAFVSTPSDAVLGIAVCRTNVHIYKQALHMRWRRADRNKAPGDATLTRKVSLDVRQPCSDLRIFNPNSIQLSNCQTGLLSLS